MQKRFMPSVLRQIRLLCRRNTHQYLMCKGDNNIITIPKIILNKEANFDETLRRYLESLSLDFQVKGIAKINIDNNGLHNFYRTTYFIELNKKQEIRNEQLFFLRYEKQTAGNIELQIRELIDEITTNKKVASLDFFRQNFKQQEPRNHSIRTLIDI